MFFFFWVKIFVILKFQDLMKKMYSGSSSRNSPFKEVVGGAN